MVEKVSEVSMHVAMKGDSTPDDSTLLKHIAKKKKQNQGDDDFSLVATLPPSVLVRLTPPLAQGGGLQKTEKQAAKKVAAASLGLAADPRQTKKGNGLRRQVALAITGQTAKPNTGKNTVIVQKGEVTSTLSHRAAVSASRSGGQAATPVLVNVATNTLVGKVISTLSHRAAASASRSGGQSTTPVVVNVATNTFVDAATKLHRSSAAQHLQAAAVVNPVIVNTSVPEAEAGRQEKQLRTKEDSGEARPLWQGAKQAETVVPKQGETTAQSRNSPVTLQELKTQAGSAGGVKGGNEGQMLEVNYQFQRWSGDHSVRISIPTDARREGNVTLLPSDARAADVLLRNIGHLTGLSPDLLRPHQERDEQQQQRRQQQQQDEDQE